MYGEDYIFYDGEFSLNIDKEINTWKDWHIFPTARPYIALPAQKLQTVDIPATSGVIDVSTIFTGYPTYENRTGSIDFGIANGYGDLAPGYSMRRYMEIAEYLNGYKHIVNIDNEDTVIDDASVDFSKLAYHFEGYLYVDAYTAGSPYSTFTMQYDFEPYRYGDVSIAHLLPIKYSEKSLENNSITFNEFEVFCNGCPIVPLITINLEGGGQGEYANPSKPIWPYKIKYRNDYLGIHGEIDGDGGSYKYPEIILYKRYSDKIDPEKKMEITITQTENAKKKIKDVTIDFVPGRL